MTHFKVPMFVFKHTIAVSWKTSCTETSVERHVFSEQLNAAAHVKLRRSSVMCFCFFQKSKSGVRRTWCTRNLMQEYNPEIFQHNSKQVRQSQQIALRHSTPFAPDIVLLHSSLIQRTVKHSKEQAKFCWIHSCQIDTKLFWRNTRYRSTRLTNTSLCEKIIKPRMPCTAENSAVNVHQDGADVLVCRTHLY